MAITTVHKNTKVATGQEVATVLKNAQNKFDELYADTEALETGLAEVEGIAEAAGKVDSVSVNGGTPVQPDGNKNINLPIDKNTVGLDNVRNVDTTNALNITTGTLAEARISGSIARVDGTNLEHYYTKTEVDEMHDILAGGLRYKGGVSGTSGLAVAAVGDQYKATAAFTLGSTKVDVGDLVIAKKATTTFDATAWDVVPSGDDGDVYADASFPAGDKVLLSDGAGKKVKSSGKGIVTVVDADSTDANIPTARAVRAAYEAAYQEVRDEFVAKEEGKGLSTNDFTDVEKLKLAGVETGAQKNTVTGVKGGSESSYRTGQINITKANIGLGNVDNTSDMNKPISSAMQTALDAKQGKLQTAVFTAATWVSSDNANYGAYKLACGNGIVLGVYNATGVEIVVQKSRTSAGVCALYSDVAFEGYYVYLN